MFHSGIGNPAAAQHPGQFRRPLVAFEILDLSGHAPVALALFHAEVMMRKAGDLRQVGYAEDLAVFPQLPQLFADRFRSTPPDAAPA